MAEQRYQAAQAAEQANVSRQTIHGWLARYEAEGFEGLKDLSHRPVHCPHQMPAEVEAVVLELPRSRPYRGPRRLVFELDKRGMRPLPSASAVWALVRAAMIDAESRQRRSRKWKRGNVALRWGCGRWISSAGSRWPMAPAPKH